MFKLTQPFLALTLILTGSLSYADFPNETGYGKLVSKISLTKSVLVDQIKVTSQGSSLSRCAKYEDDNRFDGQCLEWHAYCKFKMTLPSQDQLGYSEQYWIYDPSFFDPSLTADAFNYDCDALISNWTQMNAGKSINLVIDGNIYQSYQNDLPNSKSCIQNTIIREKVTSDNHQLFPAQSSSVISVDDKFCRQK